MTTITLSQLIFMILVCTIVYFAVVHILKMFINAIVVCSYFKHCGNPFNDKDMKNLLTDLNDGEVTRYGQDG